MSSFDRGVPTDHLWEQMFEVSGSYEAPERECALAPDLWRTKDGRVLKIKEMDHDHLKNTIIMLRRKLNYRRGARFDALELEAFRRGIIEPENPCV